MNIEFVKQIIKSKTMQGIAVTALGFLIESVKHVLTDDQYDQLNAAITLASSTLQPGGLAWAVYGRLTAKGPITTAPAPASPSFDGTGGELPK